MLSQMAWFSSISIHLSVDTKIVSISWLLWSYCSDYGSRDISLKSWFHFLWRSRISGLYGHPIFKNSFFFEILLQGPPGKSYGSPIFIFWGTSIVFFIGAEPIYIPTNSGQLFLFSTSSPTLIVAILKSLRWYLIMNMICISLMVCVRSRMFFMFLLVIQSYSLSQLGGFNFFLRLLMRQDGLSIKSVRFGVGHICIRINPVTH